MSDSIKFVTREEYDELAKEVNKTSNEVSTNMQIQTWIKQYLQEKFEALEKNISNIKHDNRNSILALDIELKKIKDDVEKLKGAETGRNMTFKFLYGAVAMLAAIVGILHLDKFFK